MKTPGKWINQTMGGCENGRQILSGKLHLATCHYGNGIDVNEANANAALIAAAPETAAERDKLKAINAELLEALEFALKALYAPDCPAIPDGAMVKGKIYSAISKAKGE